MSVNFSGSRFIQTRMPLTGPITVNHEAVPKQTNGYDCGMFVIAYCAVLTAVGPGEPLPWSMLVDVDKVQAEMREECRQIIQATAGH